MTKSKVLARLVKHGNNPQEAEKLVNKHFDYATRKYSTISKVCECIITID